MGMNRRRLFGLLPAALVPPLPQRALAVTIPAPVIHVSVTAATPTLAAKAAAQLNQLQEGLLVEIVRDPSRPVSRTSRGAFPS